MKTDSRTYLVSITLTNEQIRSLKSKAPDIVEYLRKLLQDAVGVTSNEIEGEIVETVEA